MKYSEALQYMDGLLKFGIKFGLDRIRQLADYFGNPHLRLKVIHVGGTNGKGSTATFIASILTQAGYRVGLYVSPYVYDVRERIQINGKMISENDFAEIISEIKPFADRFEETDLGSITEFEVKTMAAYLYFARQHVDFAVMEVGMGGRFDATNICKPLVSVITNVSLDHTQRLGNTVEQIAFEKSGIIKTGSILVTAAENQKVWEVILDRSRQEGVEVWRVLDKESHKLASPSADVQVRYSKHPKGFSVRGQEFNLIGLSPSLAGEFQHINASTAISAIYALKKYEVHIPEERIRDGISKAYLPGRLEQISAMPWIIIDAAHNPAAAHQLTLAISDNYRYNDLILVIGMTEGHSIRGFLAEIAPLANTIICTKSKWYKSVSAHEIAKIAHRFGKEVLVTETVAEAVSLACQIQEPGDLILVTGSFYTIGEVRIA